MAQLNTTVLDGRQVTLGELCHACDTVPFMADRRMIIVHGLLSRLDPTRGARGQETGEEEQPAWKRDFWEGLSAYLPTLPPFARLIFVESRTLSASHPIFRLVRTEGEKKRAFVRLFRLPKDQDLPPWIRQRARDHGGKINRGAASLLAALVGSDLRSLDQEIDKLVLHADGRPVNTEDVRTLVSRARDANIFELVDSVGSRQTEHALRLLHGLLDDGEAPLYLLAMLARQVRILIQVSELRDQGLSQQEIASRLKLHPYVVEKGLAQARNFEMSQLEAAHQRLVETDWAIKTGRADGVLALDLLVTQLSRS
jgi:DNA polymerase-3 subunit delta